MLVFFHIIFTFQISHEYFMYVCERKIRCYSNRKLIIIIITIKNVHLVLNEIVLNDKNIIFDIFFTLNLIKLLVLLIFDRKKNILFNFRKKSI